jgi:hypothetical protein
MTNTKPRTRKKPSWKAAPDKPGWYVVFQRGRGVDVLFWGGEDCPVFECYGDEALYYGPFRLPFAV